MGNERQPERAMASPQREQASTLDQRRGPQADAQVEQRLAGEVRRLRGEPERLGELLRGLPAWEREAAQVVLAREMGVERGREVYTRSAGQPWTLGQPVAASPIVGELKQATDRAGGGPPKK